MSRIVRRRFFSGRGVGVFFTQQGIFWFRRQALLEPLIRVVGFGGDFRRNETAYGRKRDIGFLFLAFAREPFGFRTRLAGAMPSVAADFPTAPRSFDVFVSADTHPDVGVSWDFDRSFAHHPLFPEDPFDGFGAERHVDPVSGPAEAAG